METNTKTETCDYCDAPVWGYQNGGRSKTCEHHVTRPFEEMKKATEPKWKACVECDEMITKWWLCEEGEPYCAGCFATTGASCGGCANDECPQCNDSDSEDEDAFCRGCKGEFGEDCAVPHKKDAHLCVDCYLNSHPDEDDEDYPE